jgi:hypothetical protein
MLTIVFIAISFMLLGAGGVFAFMAKYNKRRGQSGSPGTSSDAKQGRAAGLD